MATIGTSHFVDTQSARAYYKRQGFTPADVLAKVNAGEIHIGKPPLKAGQSLGVIKGEGRYCIIEDGIK